MYAVMTAAVLIAGGVLSFAAQPIVEMPSPQRTAPYGVGARPDSGAASAQTQTVPMETILAWNKVTNEVEVEAGSMVNRFNFILTNISTGPVTLTAVGTSCGCTAAKLPDLPKTVQPKESLGFEVDMNISGKHGIVEKTVTLSTDKGDQKLYVISNIKAVVTGMSDDDRKQNLQMSIADRQAIFRDDCARCHVEPTRNKTGKELFAAACGICHEAEHRATMVPDLHTLPVETSAAFWSTWITYGKPNTLMPAFSQNQGGNLTPDQITSLVDYLVTAIPPRPVQPAAPKVN
jgi:cytochrome c553